MDHYRCSYLNSKVKINPCCVLGCRDRKSSRLRFPNPKEDMFQRFFRWITLTGNSSLLDIHPFYIYSGRRMCSSHFSDDLFYPCPTVKESRRLKRDAIPNQFLPAPLTERHAYDTDVVSLSREVCRFIEERTGRQCAAGKMLPVNLQVSEDVEILGPPLLPIKEEIHEEIYQRIDSQQLEYDLVSTELKEEQEELTTGGLIALDKQSSDCLAFQAASKFYASSFGNIPAECAVDCVITEGVPPTSSEMTFTVAPDSSCVSINVPTESSTLQIKLPAVVPKSSDRKSSTAPRRRLVSILKPRANSKVVPEKLQEVALSSVPTSPVPFSPPLLKEPANQAPAVVPEKLPSQEVALFSLPNSPIPFSPPLLKEPANQAPAEVTPLAPPGEAAKIAEPEPPEAKDDSSCDSSCENSVFSLEASPPSSPIHRIAAAGEVTDNVNVELLAKSFFADAGSETLVFLTDPYYRYKLCRLCFKTSKKLTYIFGEEFTEFDLKDAVEDLLHFRVSKLDDYPQHICDICLPKLVKFKNFKDKFIKEKVLFDEELKKHGKKIDTSDRISSQAVAQDDPMPESTSDLPEDSSRQTPQKEETSHLATPKTADNFLNETSASHNDQASGNEMTSKVYDLTLPEDYDAGVNPETRIPDTPLMESSEDEGGVDNERYSSTGQEPLEPIYRVPVRKPKLEGVFPCTLCDEVFQYQNFKDDHMKEHEKTFPYPCTDCDRRFQSLVKLNAHIVTHSDYKQYECELCGKRIRHQVSLRRHKERYHQGKKYLCSECGEDFNDTSNFLRHMMKHRGVKRYACAVCRREFTQSYSLREHMASHSTVDSFVCERCGSGFASKERLRRHMARVHSVGVEVGCDVCGKNFRNRKNMAQHRKWHFSKRPIRKRSNLNKVVSH